jgi:tetratricopeptide (TPR) repeat protein
LSTSPAYDSYLRGKVLVASENRADNDAAIQALRKAVSIDPAFAPAHADLARAYAIKSFYFAPDSEKKTLREEAEIAVEKALGLDPNLAEAYFARGLLLWTPSRRFPHEQAVQAYRKALELNPKLDEAHHQIALVFLHIGLLEEARSEIDTALTINPANTLARFRIGVIELYSGNNERAYTIFHSTPLERNPTLWTFQSATALFRLGRDREAMDLLDRFLREFPTDEGGVGASTRAMILAKSGRRSEAEAAIAKAIQLGGSFGHFHHTAYSIAIAYALLGDRQRAIGFLENAADDGFPCYPLFANDVLLDELRAEPRFIALLSRLQREWQERKRIL